MTGRVLRISELCLAVLALALAVWCWRQGVSTTEFEPLIEGTPAFTGTHYSGSWIGGATALVTAAGLLVLDVVRRR
ncbi:hypothetical protein [Rhodococcus kronopolitis]|uniref:Uncharacterized protein n=1 Tax=Rhodococcus kronopolitis TaxID=1460226 RepID=A0ABV9FVX9_9NOCA